MGYEDRCNPVAASDVCVFHLQPQESMTGKYILRKDRKPNEFGEYGICLYYSTNSIPVKKSMGLFIHPDFWLGDNGSSDNYVLGGDNGHPKADIYNSVLAKKKKEIDTIINGLLANEDFEMTVPILRSILNGTYKQELEQQKGRVSFVDEVLAYNKSLYQKEKISYSVWHNIGCNMSNFRKFLQKEKKLDTNPSKTLYCCNLTVELIEDYITWRKQRGNTNDTINKTLTPIFKTIKRLMRLGWIKREVGDEILELYLPTQVRSLTKPTDDVDYLTPEQVKKLIELTQQSKYPRTKELMDMFLFSMHCGGMRFSDVCTLRWMEVYFQEKLIRHLQVKNHTKRPVILNLPITSECMKILERWMGRNENFVFGMLDDEFDLDDEEKLKLTINSRNKTMNQSLQCMGEKMGLPFRLHFHIARHTFASIAINRGVDIKTISYLMGHTTTMITEKVYAKLFPSTLAEVVSEKLDFSFD